MPAAPAHIGVMVDQVAACVAPVDGGRYADGTYGRGTYCRALLDAADCHVYAIDRDPAAVAHGRRLADRYPGRLTVLEGTFAEIDHLLQAAGVDQVQGVTFDLGPSSPQLDDAARGFSFQQDGPLDMRMSGRGETAADAVNNMSVRRLADVIFEYGDEHRARAIARAIDRARNQKLIETTGELARIITGAVGPARGKIHPATKTFQALRILINDELGQLRRGLRAAERILAPGGRLAVVAFHSLEDRIVKMFLRDRAGHSPQGSRHRPPSPASRPLPTFRLLRRGAIKPTADEIAVNPRARSARLRAAIRTDAPAWPAEVATCGVQ